MKLQQQKIERRLIKTTWSNDHVKGHTSWVIYIWISLYHVFTPFYFKIF